MDISFINFNNNKFSNIDIKKYLCFLNSEEICRFENIKSFQVKRNFLFGRVLLKEYLRKNFNCNISEIQLENNKFGKPKIKNNKHNIQFNISHSKNLVVLATSEDEIGVDIEFQKERDFAKIENYYFTESEIKTINKNKNNFYSIWTLKESFVKLHGKSILSEDVKLEFLIDISNKNIKTKLDQNYLFETYKINKHYILSIATDRTNINNNISFSEVILNGSITNIEFKPEILLNNIKSSK